MTFATKPIISSHKGILVHKSYKYLFIFFLTIVNHLMNPNLTLHKCDTSSNEDEIHTRALQLLFHLFSSNFFVFWLAISSACVTCVMREHFYVCNQGSTNISCIRLNLSFTKNSDVFILSIWMLLCSPSQLFFFLVVAVLMFVERLRHGLSAL